jgi:hypothetical protein
LGGKQLDTLKLDEFAKISLEQPIAVGTYPSTTDSNCLCCKEAYHHNWSVTVHLFRLDDSKFCGVLHKSDSYLLMRFDYPTENVVDRRLSTAFLRFEASVDTALPVPTCWQDGSNDAATMRACFRASNWRANEMCGPSARPTSR